MPTVLIVFSTVDGQTLKICERIRLALETCGHRVTLAEVGAARALDVASFDKVVIGASIRYGHHRRSVFDFIEENLAALERLPGAFFSVNVVARKPGKDTPAGNPYLRAFCRRSPWRPRELAAFAGRIDYARYRLADRLMIRLIMWLTKGPTDPHSDVEFTRWDEVERFAARVAAM